jgi:hypothetical protein
VDLKAPVERVALGGSKALVRRLVGIVNDRDLDALEEVTSGQIALEARAGSAPSPSPFRTSASSSWT